MRKEFKFRAWNTKESKWMFGYEYPELGGFSLLGETVLTGQLSSISLEDLDDVEIMQFTGFKDTDGKEIYEGDLLEHGLFKGYISEVSFKDGSFYLKSGTSACMRHFDLSNSKIVGNIYEN